MMQAGTDIVRLHITPFSQSIYEKNIPQAVRDNNPKVSFHAIQTFPERGFGYLELAKSDADAVKRKLNGSILKGVKIRIESARPMKRKSDAAEEDSVEPSKKRSKKVKVEKQARQVVLPGYELPEDRAVKRGWSDEKSAGKKVKKSEDTKTMDREKSKLLFKTIVPANVKIIDKEKSRKRKDKSDKPARRNEVTVKEFGHSRSTFAVSKASSAVQKPAVEYQDDLGWVDEDGDVVEPETTQIKRKRQQTRPEEQTAPAPTAMILSPQPGSSESDKSSSDESTREAQAEDESEEESEEDAGELPARSSTIQPPSTTYHSNSESEEDDEDEAMADKNGTDSDDSDQEQQLTAQEVHPLEALYKKPKQGPKEQLPPINTSFSFFGGGDVDEDMADEQALPPQTPHTKQDMDWRRQRSAAPTPDTAAIDGRFGFPFDMSDEEEEEDGMPTPIQPASQPVDSAVDTSEQSDFRKWFFEHRGDNNRAWKRLRREAKKVQRQRENRRLTRRIV